MRAEIIAIGDELTSGQRLDTNSQWLSERLVEMGVDVAFHTTAGDDLDADLLAFRTAIERADFVVSTGGLGPTADDLTREAIAAATGVELVEDAAALEHIRGLFARRGRPMPERNVLQAKFPSGSRPVPNRHGTAPGIDMSLTRPDGRPCRLFALPGVPAELFVMWAETVAPAILAAQAARRVTRHYRIKCFGAGESDVERMIPDLICRGRDPRVGITVSDATITLRITASGPDESACRELIAPTAAEIRKSLGVLVFGQEEDELQHAVVRLLVEQQKTVAVAEWATDGLVAHWLADAANSRCVLRGGVIIRSVPMLTSLLGIAGAEDTIAPIAAGASPIVAEAMARAVRERTGADIGLAVAAMPIGCSGSSVASASKEPQGMLSMALATGQNVRTKDFPLAGHPAVIRARAAKQALNLLRLALLNQN